MAPQWQVPLTLVDIWRILLYALYNQKVCGSGDIELVALEVEDESVRHGGDRRLPVKWANSMQSESSTVTHCQATAQLPHGHF